MCSHLNRLVRRHNKDIFSIFFNMIVYCVFSFESARRGDSNEYTCCVVTNLHGMNFFLGTQEGVQNSSGKRIISVRATEVLL